MPDARPFDRFLWRDLDLQKAPEEYEFSRVVFRVNSSLFIAQFMTQHHAEIHRTAYPFAAETALKSNYMDDSMDSVSTDEQGIHARKWLSNSPVVLNEIPPEDRASKVLLQDP